MKDIQTSQIQKYEDLLQKLEASNHDLYQECKEKNLRINRLEDEIENLEEKLRVKPVEDFKELVVQVSTHESSLKNVEKKDPQSTNGLSSLSELRSKTQKKAKKRISLIQKQTALAMGLRPKSKTQGSSVV